MNATKEEKSTLFAGRLFHTLMTWIAKYEDLTLSQLTLLMMILMMVMMVTRDE